MFILIIKSTEILLAFLYSNTTVYNKETFLSDKHPLVSFKKLLKLRNLSNKENYFISI